MRGEWEFANLSRVVGGMFLAEGMTRAKKLSLERWCSVGGKVRILARLGLRVGAYVWRCIYVYMCSVGLLRVVGEEPGKEVGARW